MAIGNNARFTIDQGGRLIIDKTCQLEIEWDAATTTPAADGSTPATPDVLNNGVLDIRAGGEVVNNGIITIEGFEGKPAPAGTDTQPVETEKSCGEMTIGEGATLTNNGSLMVYGILYNLGTLVNNGRYDDVIASNDPDAGVFNYHRGIVISWKDDVTQSGVQPGALYNGQDRDGGIHTSARLVNNGDIALAPGTLENRSEMTNASGSNVYVIAATEAIIPITPTAEAPTVVTKRITLDPAKGSHVINRGTLLNDGRILPGAVVINDNTSFGAISTPGGQAALFDFENHGVVANNGYIYNWPTAAADDTLIITLEMDDSTMLYLYVESQTFQLVFPDGQAMTGAFRFDGDALVFVLEDGTEAAPERNDDGNWDYAFVDAAGYEATITLTAEFTAYAKSVVDEYLQGRQVTASN